MKGTDLKSEIVCTLCKTDEFLKKVSINNRKVYQCQECKSVWCLVCGKKLGYCRQCGQILDCFEARCEYCLPCHSHLNKGKEEE